MNPEIDLGVGPAEIRKALDEIVSWGSTLDAPGVSMEAARTIAAVLRGILDGIATKGEEYSEPEDSLDPEWIGPECLVRRIPNDSREALKSLKAVHVATAADLSGLFEALTSSTFDPDQAVTLCAVYMQETLRAIRESSRQHPLLALLGRHAHESPPEAKH